MHQTQSEEPALIRAANSTELQVIIEECTDPVINARAKAMQERGKLNDDWLQVHWGEPLVRPNRFPRNTTRRH